MPPGAAPQAPPDDVLLLPMARWHELFDPQAAARPDSVRLQLHVRLAHGSLPAGPGAAYVAVQQAAHNLEARIAGSGIVADNLAARLGGAREDALYAGVLFLFLGVPGAILAAILTLSVAASGASRRRQEQALLRVRGASTPLLLRLAGAEAAVVGVAGVALGLALAAASAVLLGAGSLSAPTLPWAGAAALLGLVLAAAAVLLPAWHAARRSTVAAARVAVGREGVPLWQRLWLDLAMLAAAGAVLWWQAGTGYQVVLAPEGVAQASVHYEAFLAPVLLWTGASLLALRLWRLLLGRGRGLVGGALRPLAGDLAGVVAASLARQRRRVAQGVALGVLALSFAVSTAVFDTTYEAQARVDAALTNGADVTVTGTTAAPASAKLAELSTLPGVAAAEPMQHRYAYVGSDLQDLYGIDPTRIGRATRMADAYFEGGDARATLAALAAQRDGVLVSEETVRDFQLRPGDRLNLRLQLASDHQYHVVPFRFAGVAREFPTAPKDSFLVANAAYVAEATGSPAAEIVLLATGGDPAAVAARARQVVASLPGAKVTAIGETRQIIGSSLTAVDLRGLTRLELGFAVLMVAGAVGLVLALDLAERRRAFAILAALGAKERQLGAFLWGEGLLVLAGAAAGGGLIGWAVAATLVAMLTGVFDPPPQALAVPWAYLLVVAAAATLAVAAAVLGTLAAARRPAVEALRDG